MSKYRVTLTIHETGGMSKEDFRKLQEAVNQIAEITEFKMIIENECMVTSSIATMMSLLPKNAFEPTAEDQEATRKAYLQTQKAMGLGYVIPDYQHPTHRDIYGHDLPEYEKEVSSPS